MKIEWRLDPFMVGRVHYTLIINGKEAGRIFQSVAGTRRYACYVIGQKGIYYSEGLLSAQLELLDKLGL